MKQLIAILFLIIIQSKVHAAKLFIPMDETQTNHLKAYGLVYNAIADGVKVDWLLNFKGGSFAMDYSIQLDAACKRNSVSFRSIGNNEYAGIVKKIIAPNFNGDLVVLDKVPKIAVYTPSGKKPWDDAVTLALTYASIPFDKLYVTEVLAGNLSGYDWLHLHHEDFTGQYGKFWTQYMDAAWYRNDVRDAEKLAASHGYKKVWQMQLAVVKKIRDFVATGGNLFAMCSATDTYDIALAANGTDICDSPFDGDGISPNAQSRLNFNNCFAFTGFNLSFNRYEYEYATIDNTNFRFLPESTDYFMLAGFQAKFDAVPSMLCQNHTRKIKGFMGQTTAFRKEALKPDVVILADRKDVHETRYIHGNYKEGTWTFYGGHDPEDYQHLVGEPPTDLELHPNSPGYRLILNNVLCLASGKKDVQPLLLGRAQNNVTTKPANTTADANPIKITAGSSNNTLVIAIDENAANKPKIEQVSFVNFAGKEVKSLRFNARKVSVDMEDLPAGMYNVKVNGVYAGKIVKN